MIKVGIPRALLFYQYYPMWKTFFEGLGAELVISEPTTRSILAAGSSRVVSETCLPTKVFIGHAMSLVGKCDYLFVPCVKSIEEKVYNCSKFLGLPDLVKAVVPGCPPILDVDIDINKGKNELYKEIYSLGKLFSWNPLRIKGVAEKAWQEHHSYIEYMRREKVTPPQALETIYGLSCDSGDREDNSPKWENGAKREHSVGVIGHPYNIYDEFINHRLMQRISGLGVSIHTGEMATEEELNKGVERLVGKPYWTYEDEFVGAGGHYLGNQVDGVISVIAFGCGPDSVMQDVVQRYAKNQANKPYMAITIDEHTGEAGLVTRIEAFVDMLVRRVRVR